MSGALMTCPHCAGLGRDSAVTVIDAALQAVKRRPVAWKGLFRGP